MSNQSINKTEFISKANSEELEKIRDFVEGNAKEFGFDDKSSMQIALAVDEACSNLIQHAGKIKDNDEFYIRIENRTKKFIIRIIDKTQPFDPTKVPSPNMKEYFEEFRRGGLGIQIIKKVMDEIVYEPADTNSSFNTLSLIKILQ